MQNAIIAINLAIQFFYVDMFGGGWITGQNQTFHGKGWRITFCKRPKDYTPKIVLHSGDYRLLEDLIMIFWGEGFNLKEDIKAQMHIGGYSAVMLFDESAVDD